MVVFSDDNGNHFLGDCLWGTHSEGYPDIKYLKANEMNTFSADLTSILTLAGLPFRNVIQQSVIDAWLSGSAGLASSLVHFGSVGDIDDRYSFAVSFNANNTGSGRPVNLFDDDGSVNITNNVNESTNLLAGCQYPTGNIYGISGGITNAVFNRSGVNADYSPIYVCGVANANGVALNFSQKRLLTGTGVGYVNWFVYAGKLVDVNTNGNYYSSSIPTQSIIVAGGNNSFTSANNNLIALNARHYINEQSKYPYGQSYAIACADSQFPTGQWTSDFCLYDDNSGLNYPIVGKADNLLLADGLFTLHKQVKVKGNVLPDNGFNRWLPVGSYRGKTAFMRCYSSIDI